MRIGVLTFHWQMNYGGVLQALATKTFLQKHGHEALFVKPRERNSSQISLAKRILSAISWTLKVILRGDDWGIAKREKKTLQFLAEYLPEVSKPLTQWKTKEDAEEIRTLIVGSDQVWNTRLLEDRAGDYLPSGLKRLGIRQIAYAASVGMLEVPNEDKALFKERLPEFDVISVRESASVDLLREFYHKEIQHACDPTLLLSATEWESILRLPPRCQSNRVFCYALDLKDDFINNVIEFSKRTKQSVDVFTEVYPSPMPRNVRDFCKKITLRMRLVFSSVRICRNADPCDFVRAIRDSRCVMADSFHALMFATIFNRPVRIVVDSSNEYRVKMSARIVEFVEKYGTNIAIEDSWNTAWQLNESMSVRKTCELHDWIDLSKDWLIKHV